MTAAPMTNWLPSSKNNPCPICGRTKDGDCRISADRLQVICHRGCTHSPPDGLQPSRHPITGKDGQAWAYTHDNNRGAHFTIDKPCDGDHHKVMSITSAASAKAQTTAPLPVSTTGPITLARLPERPEEPPAKLPNGTRLDYSQDPKQWVVVRVNDDRKKFIPHHIDGKGKPQPAAGPDPWPLWKEQLAIEHGPGHWVAEAEGEKCARWLQAGGVVAVSQPGHDHRTEKIQPRYQRLKDAGVLGVVYLEDNDQEGRKRSQQSKDAAAAVGLPLLVLPAAEVWPGLPEKGSIDDAPGTAADRVAALEAAIIAALQHQRQPQPEPLLRRETDATYRELLAAALEAVRHEDEDAEMEARAEIMARFKRTDAAITESLFKLLTEQEGGAITAPTYRSVNLARVDPIEWQLEGFIPANDLTLLYGQAGAGKTTAALALAFAVVDGTGFLDRDSPATPGRVLFIASDSGASPLLTALHSLGLADHPAVAHGDGQRFFVWAHDAGQGALAWDASLRGCLKLLEFVQRERIDMVVIDSCKAVTAKAGISYTDNGQVAALLTFIKEVVCRHCSVVPLNHDGTARGESAGAKAWKEIPSAVHCIETVLEANEQTPGEQRSGIESRDLRRWVVKKCRVPGVAREFRFFLDHDTGRLEPCPEVERIADCRAAITEVLSQALKNGELTLARGVIARRCWDRWHYSQKSVDNSLSRIVAAKHPEVVRAPQRGHYRLAPRMTQALSQYTSLSQGKEQGERVVVARVLGTSLQVPEGTQRELDEFPEEDQGNSTNPSQRDGSDQVPSPGAEMGIEKGASHVVEASTSEPTETRREATPAAQQNISIADVGPTTTTDWVRLALSELRLAPHTAMVTRVMAWLDQIPEQPGCTRSAVFSAMARLQEEDDDTAATAA